MTDHPTSLLLLALFSVLYIVLKRRWRARIPYPPGPKGWPLIGNVFDIPTRFQWRAYREMEKQYGNIIHLEALGHHLVVINSAKVAEDLLTKRSRIYSDRPEITVMNMNGWHINMGLKHYGDDWRKDRRIMHQRLRREETPALYPILLARTNTLLLGLLNEGQNFERHFQVFPASAMMYAVYGHNAASDDQLIDLTFEVIGLFADALFLGTNLVNMFPRLRHIPPWFPMPLIQEVHRRCAYSRELLETAQNVPFEAVRQHMAKGTAVPSWIQDLLDSNETNRGYRVEEDKIRALGVICFAAAMETILSFLLSFALAMVLFPDVQARAQAEIDSVIGNGRLPTFEDRESLPYVDAVMKEVLRWHGPFPMGVPHASLDDDVYDGMYIPKGSIVIYNQWAMCRDESIYPDPDTFKPERFIGSNGLISGHYPPVFGFGRRICVGRHAADASMWIAVASILAVFRIGKAKDLNGNEIEVTEEYHDGIVSSPSDLHCSFTPRSEVHKQLILENPSVPLKSNPIHFTTSAKYEHRR